MADVAPGSSPVQSVTCSDDPIVTVCFENAYGSFDGRAWSRSGAPVHAVKSAATRQA